MGGLPCGARESLHSFASQLGQSLSGSSSSCMLVLLAVLHCLVMWIVLIFVVDLPSLQGSFGSSLCFVYRKERGSFVESKWISAEYLN